MNLLNTNETYTLAAGSQTPAIAVPAVTAKIFIAQSQWKPLDPVVVSNSPAHWNTNVSTFSPVVLQFSKPMNTNSVQSAFATTPAAGGSFTWSSVNAANDTMTFIPGAGGWPGSAWITARLTNTAMDAVSGNAMYSPWQMQFKTAAQSTLVPPTIAVLTPANGATIAGNFQISGTASDTVAVQSVQVQLDNGAWTTAAGTSNWSLTLNSSNFLNGPHVITALATDTSGNVSNNSVNVSFINVPGNYVQRVSGGNPANVTDCSGNVWLEDTNYSVGAFGYSRGTNGYLDNSIVGVCSSAQSLYQRERYSTGGSGFLYQFDCPEGVYQITLLEAETYWSGPGEREFNVFIQGRQVLTNYDIYAKAGGQNVPVTLAFTNNVTNSQLQILFISVVDNARVSGVQVVKLANVFSDTDGIPDWWRLAYFGHALGQAGDKSRGQDDADGNGILQRPNRLRHGDQLELPPSVQRQPGCRRKLELHRSDGIGHRRDRHVHRRQRPDKQRKILPRAGALIQAGHLEHSPRLAHEAVQRPVERAAAPHCQVQSGRDCRASGAPAKRMRQSFMSSREYSLSALAVFGPHGPN
jgi:hypothetical protein